MPFPFSKFSAQPSFSLVTSLADRVTELEARLKCNADFERRLERVESRLGINEMLSLVERNRKLEEKIRTLESAPQPTQSKKVNEKKS